MTKRSQTMESFSHLIVAIAGGLAVMGAIAFAFVVFDDHGCSAGAECRSAAQMHQVHY